MEAGRPSLAFVGPVPSLLKGHRSILDRRNVPRKAVVRRPIVRASMDEGFVDGSEYNLAGAVAQKAEKDLGNGPEVAFGQLPDNVRKTALGAFVVGAGIAGYTITADQQKVLNYGVAVVSAGVAAAGSSVVLKSGRIFSKKACAEVLAKLGPADPRLPEALEEVKQDFALNDTEWRVEMQALYAAYLAQMVSGTNGEVFYKEVNTLIGLKQTLGLSGAEVGDAHFEVGRSFYRENIVFLDDPEGGAAAETAQKMLNKLLFLSDRMFSDKEPEESYMYDTARMRKHYGMDEEEYDRRVAATAEPFYEDCILYAMNNSVSAAELRSAQHMLGIKDDVARKMEKDNFSGYVQGLVKETGEVAAEDVEELSNLRTLLNVNEEEAQTVLRRVAEPEFKAAIKTAFNALQESDQSVDEISEALIAEQGKLRIPADLSKESIAAEVHERCLPYLSSSIKFLRVSNVFACAKEIVKLLEALDKMVSLLSKLNADLSPLDLLKVYATSDGKLKESVQLYSIYLQEVLKRDGKVSDTEKENLERLKIVFGLSTFAAGEAYRKATGPMFKRALAGVFAANKFDDDALAKLETMQSDLTLPEDTALEMKLDSYGDRLQTYVKDTRILSAEEATLLKKIQEFLGLEDEAVMKVHERYCSRVYEQSVSEAMGTSGVIMENVMEALIRLKGRLMLSEETADQIFFAVAKGRMKAYALRAFDTIEKKRQARGSGEKRDVGDDPFIKRAGAQLGIDASGLNVELHNLVDFYIRNRLMRTNEVEYEEDGETKTKRVSEFPVTLRDTLNMDMLTELYKQYLIQCFSAKSREEKERLFGVLDQLASILGLEQTEVDKIHSDIGSVIYRNYVSQQLLQSNLEEKDIQFLTNIQNTLAMTPKQCAEIMYEAKKGRVSVLLEQTISRNKILPENAKKVRTTATALDISLVEDLKVPNVDRMRVFNVEIDNGIETGDITASKQDLINEAKEGWGLSDQDAKKVLLENIERRSANLLVQAASSLRQGNQENAVREVATMLRFGRLLPAEVTSPVVSDAEKQELLLLYQAYLISDSALTDEARKDISLLTTMLGISDEVLQGA